MYYVYILSCADGTLYTGITTDLERRLHEHNHSAKGARYTRSRRPVTVVYQECLPDRSSATKREFEIKKMNRMDKCKLMESMV
jgi:putative endonuclease